MAPKLLTIGYQERSLDDFTDLLKGAGVTVVLDVRESPRSRKPGFGSRRLAEHLAKAGIRYQHLPFVGNPRAFRSQGLAHSELLSRYDEWIASRPDLIDAFDQVLTPLLDAGDTVALMCYERHPDDCHRTLLARRWQGRTGHAATPLDPDGARRFTRRA